MEYRQLGDSGLRVSALTMGTMTFGGTRRVRQRRRRPTWTARRQVDMCLDAGINLIDTADVYSGGLVRGDRGRGARAAGATTCWWPPRSGCRWAAGPNDAGLSRHHVISGCEASLRRLGTDHIDLYQVHEWDGQTPLEETLRAGPAGRLGQGPLRRRVQLRRLAADEGAGRVADRHGLPRFVSQQIYYSLQARDAEYELIPLARRPGPRHPGLEPAGRRPAVRQVPARPAGAGGLPPVRRLGRAAGLRRGRAVRHDRGAGRDRRGARGLRGPGRPGLAAGPAGGDLGDHRGADRRAAGRQPRRRRRSSSADAERARLDEVSRPPLRLPVLAPAQHRPRPAGAADLAHLRPYL